MANYHPAGDLPDYARKKPSKQAVSISRKDTIIIAMLVNIALLAVLFATATRRVPESPMQAPLQSVQSTVQAAPIVAATPVEKVQAVDEIDEILKTYARKVSQPESKREPQPVVKKEAPKPVEKPEFYTVQNGDSPWKIAKKCNIKVEDLLRLNNLDEEKARNLKIGQKLRIR